MKNRKRLDAIDRRLLGGRQTQASTRHFWLLVLVGVVGATFTAILRIVRGEVSPFELAGLLAGILIGAVILHRHQQQRR